MYLLVPDRVIRFGAIGVHVSDNANTAVRISGCWQR